MSSKVHIDISREDIEQHMTYAWDSYKYHKDQINKWVFYLHVVLVMVVIAGILGKGFNATPVVLTKSHKELLTLVVFLMTIILSGIFSLCLHHHASAKLYRLIMCRLRDLETRRGHKSPLTPYMLHRLYISRRKAVFFLKRTSVSGMALYTGYLYIFITMMLTILILRELYIKAAVSILLTAFIYIAITYPLKVYRRTKKRGMDKVNEYFDQTEKQLCIKTALASGNQFNEAEWKSLYKIRKENGAN